MDFQRNFQHCLAIVQQSYSLRKRILLSNTEVVEHSLEQFGVGWNRNLEAPHEIKQNFSAHYHLSLPYTHTHPVRHSSLPLGTFHSRLQKYSKSNQINGRHSMAVEDAKSPVQEICNTGFYLFFSTVQHMNIGLQISAATCAMCYEIQHLRDSKGTNKLLIQKRVAGTGKLLHFPQQVNGKDSQLSHRSCSQRPFTMHCYQFM